MEIFILNNYGADINLRMGEIFDSLENDILDVSI